MTRTLGVIAVLFAASGVAAQKDPLPAAPGHSVASTRLQQHGEIEVPLPGGGETRAGRLLHATYQRGAKGADATAVVRHYEALAKQRGGETLYERLDADGASGEATLSFPAGTRWLWVFVAADPKGYELDELELAAEPTFTELGADDLLAGLDESGSVEVLALRFHPGKDTFRPDAERALAQVTALLSANPALRVVIQAHTDGADTAEARLALAQRRAERVRQHLRGKGIDARRLETKGFGDVDGGTRNRIDLVKAL